MGNSMRARARFFFFLFFFLKKTDPGKGTGKERKGIMSCLIFEDKYNPRDFGPKAGMPGLPKPNFETISV